MHNHYNNTIYSREISKIGNGTTKHEKELNLKLINQESKQCIMPDAVFDAVDKHIKFRPLHGPKKNVSQNLVPQRLYVVHDNIEVLEPEDTGDYSGIDKPNYRVRMDESTKAGMSSYLYFFLIKHLCNNLVHVQVL